MKSLKEILEIDQVFNLIQKHAQTGYAKKMIRELVMFSYRGELEEELLYTQEALNYLYKYQSLSIYPLNNLLDSLALIEKGASVELEFFYQVSRLLENASVLKRETMIDNEFPLLKGLLERLILIPTLKKKIDVTLAPDLTISSEASFKLSSIRKAIQSEEQVQSVIMNRLVQKYGAYLNDERIALKDQTKVLAIKASYKGKVDGVVVAVSASQQTVFIEPNEIIASNNKIYRLKQEENEEISRIIKELLDEIKRNFESLCLDHYLIARLDFLMAKAQYAKEYDAVVGKVSEKPIISLKGARHPLLDQKNVVKNSFELYDRKILLISGPNAGGKTVALKTIGLFVYLHQCGLPLPCDEPPLISFFKEIFVDIGDHQSLLDNLSTFSGHIENIRLITEQVDEDSLVILDELGTGTSPLDGEALAIGVINFLIKKGCFAIISSHYEGLKNYSLENQAILPSSMIFDEEKLLPTYHLRLGSCGKSYGIEVASRLGLNHQIIENAKHWLNEAKNNSKDLLLDELVSKIEETEKLKDRLLSEKNQLEAALQETEQKQKALFKEQQRIKDKAQEEIETLVAEAAEKIEQIFEELKDKETIKTHEIISSRRRLQALSEQEETKPIVHEFQIDDYVAYEDLAIRGRIIRIKNDDCYVLTDEGKSMWIPKSSLVLCRPKAKEKKQYVNSDFTNLKIVPLELNIIGYHIEEGLEAVSKYIDDALVAHYKQVRIIHGSGSGKLRAAVQDYLKHHPHVLSYRLGGLNEGGVGATVVILK